MMKPRAHCPHDTVFAEEVTSPAARPSAGFGGRNRRDRPAWGMPRRQASNHSSFR